MLRCGICFLRLYGNSSPCLLRTTAQITNATVANIYATTRLSYWRKSTFSEVLRFCCCASGGLCDADFSGNYLPRPDTKSRIEAFKEDIKLLSRSFFRPTNMIPTERPAPLVAVSTPPDLPKHRSDLQLASDPCQSQEEIIIEDQSTDSPSEKEEKKNFKRKGNHNTAPEPVAKRGGTKIQRSIDSFSLCKKPANLDSSTSEAIRSSVLQFGRVGAHDPIPLSFLTWNLNGLLPRVRASQWKQFADYVKETKPDVICLQEIRLPALGPAGCRKNDGQPRDRGAVRVEVAAAATAAERREVQTIAACLRQALSALPDYHVLMSLADWKYSGQFLLLRRHLRVESVRFNLNEEDPCIHHTEGRVIVADFGCFSFLTTYSPNNGWVETSFQRRRKWDEELLKFVQQQKKPLIWMGDANCYIKGFDFVGLLRQLGSTARAPTDADLSHPKIFRSAHQPDPNLSPEDVGQPGCTDAERKRLKDILEAGKLVDVYRQRNPRTTPAPVQDSAYTWRGYSEDRSPSSARAMRLDHAFASEELLPSVVSVEIVGGAFPRRRFFGSDHCPVLLRLSEAALRSRLPTE